MPASADPSDPPGGEGATPRQSRTPSTPAELWQTVVACRGELARHRRQGSSGSVERVRRDLLDALEAYVASLDERGLPVPYALRDDLRIQRLTGATGDPERYRPRQTGAGPGH